MSKPKVLKDYSKLSDEMQERLKLFYPNGFSEFLIRFVDSKGKNVSALPYEAEDKFYMIRMTNLEAQKIIKDDTDYDDEGNLKDDIKDDYEDKYTDLDTMRVGSGRKSGEDEDYD
jgi:hypothetical protein